MRKIILNDIVERESDTGFEVFRAIKTLCLIIIIFCIGFIYRRGYLSMLENSRFMRFYPASTVFYQDFTSIGDFEKFELPSEYKSVSYGIFKDERGKDKFLMIARTPDADTPIIDTKDYSLFTKDGYTFISNSDKELINLQKRIAVKNYEFIKTTNIKNMLKKLDAKRDYTIVVTDINYTGIPLDADTKNIFAKIFDKSVIQLYRQKDGVSIKGEVVFKNKIAGIAATAKAITENFANRNIAIEYFDKDKVIFVAGVKDFDLWTKAFLKITQTMQGNQYGETFNLIQSGFNSDVEEDIVKKLSGNAVFYLFKDKKDLHPMIVVETKRDLVNQAQKYLSFLQLQNNSKFSEKQINNQTYNILSTGFYPYNLSFTTTNENLFVLGHQNIIENYLGEKPKEKVIKKCDFYLFSDLQKTPLFKNNKGFWDGYKTIELELKLTPSVNFEGKLTK